MGLYRRPFRFSFNVFRSYTSNITARRNPIQESSLRAGCYTDSLKPSFNKSRISEFSQPIFRNSALQNGFKSIQCNSPFLHGAKRFYYVDKYQVYHFKQRGFKRWFQNPRNVIIVVLVGSGVVITIYFGNLETVPYTKRTHFVLLSKNMEKELGETQFKELKQSFKGKILPPLHPESIRVQAIAHDIIEALQRGLREEKVWSDVRYSPESVGLPHETSGHETLMGLGEKITDEDKWLKEEKWHKDDEILDDHWVQKSRKEGQKKGMKSESGHLEGLKWEVIVVNEPIVNAFCLPGGKIVVFTGLLNNFRSDYEIATILSHEVAHAVARHSAEQMSKNLWLTILQLILYQFVMPDLVNTMSHFFLRLPFSRRMEMEADHIGLMLMASAGYDPRLAPQVYEKLGRISGESALREYLSTHPSGKRRSQMLAQAKVMEEALELYREVHVGRGIEGFL